MNPTVPIMLFGWLPASVAMFLFLPMRKAASLCLIGGWLFLPEHIYHLSGLPDYGKMTAISAGVMAGIILFDLRTLLNFRPSPIDAPMLIWCLVPMASSISNLLGVYDGISAIIGNVITFGVPWLVGRLYFSSREGLRDLAQAILYGALFYSPFILFEARMSPNLNWYIYGFQQHVFAQTWRMGGWRPLVFLEHGLALGMWMTAASICGIWLWRTKAISDIFGLPVGPVIAGLLVVTVLSRSAGALGLLVVGLILLIGCSVLRHIWPMLVLATSIPSYIFARIAFDWQADPIVNFAKSINVNRGNSLGGRIRADSIIAEHAKERMFFGWGGWDRFRLDTGPVLPDTMWVITFGQHGLVGLTCLYLSMLLPTVTALWGIRRQRLQSPELAGVVALSLVVLLWLCDSLSNRMISPVYICAAGGLTGWARLTIPVLSRKTPLTESADFIVPPRRNDREDPGESEGAS